MEGAPFHDEADSSVAINRGKLRAVVVHDSESPLEQKELLLAALKSEFGKQMSFDFTWWKIDHLRSVPVSFLAIQAAGKSDLIIFNVPFPENLPEYAGSWLRHCLRMNHPHKPIVLLVISRSPSPRESTSRFNDDALLATKEFGVKLSILPLSTSEDQAKTSSATKEDQTVQTAKIKA